MILSCYVVLLRQALLYMIAWPAAILLVKLRWASLTWLQQRPPLLDVLQCTTVVMTSVNIHEINWLFHMGQCLCSEHAQPDQFALPGSQHLAGVVEELIVLLLVDIGHVLEIVHTKRVSASQFQSNPCDCACCCSSTCNQGLVFDLCCIDDNDLIY